MIVKGWNWWRETAVEEQGEARCLPVASTVPDSGPAHPGVFRPGQFTFDILPRISSQTIRTIWREKWPMC